MQNYLPALKEKLGKILSTGELMPGVYHIVTTKNNRFTREYYVVLDTAPIAVKVQNYGEKMDGLRLFEWDAPSGESRLVHYEYYKHLVASNPRYLNEFWFRDKTLHTMEMYPEYFGMFPVPFHTPCGYTLLHRTLSNGIYWLETSECKELLSVCPTIWEAELSYTARTLGKTTDWDGVAGKLFATAYLFFPKEASCIPLYELMETRKEWDGTVIDCPALMNAIWEFMPQYAMRLNGQKDVELQTIASDFWKKSGIEPLPEPDGKRVIGMYPEAGTDFLLLK